MLAKFKITNLTRLFMKFDGPRNGNHKADLLIFIRSLEFSYNPSIRLQQEKNLRFARRCPFPVSFFPLRPEPSDRLSRVYLYFGCFHLASKKNLRSLLHFRALRNRELTMDFDEYEYLEKTVENPDLAKEDSSMRNGVASEEKGQHKTSSRSRTDNADRDSERHSKRVKSEEEHDRHRNRDREKDRERDRGSSRHRSYADRDGERGEKERRRSSREERNGKDRDRERDKEREKEKIKERDREMERELERERDRSKRSRSRSERHQDEERDKHRERSRDRDIRESEREGRHKKEAVEPEADPERDQRTVFAYQINLKADERDVYEFFSRAGKVRDVRLIMDRNSRRSKGVGYIEFYDAMSVPMAIALTGQMLLGQAVMVKPSEAEKNLVQSTSTAAGGAGALGAQSGGARKLYVGNLHFNINEEQIRAVFESFGTVELVQLPLDPETGHCKGFGFVQFARLEDARAAQSINGQLEIAGRTIKVSAVTDQVGMQDAGASAKDLDDDEGGGLTLNAHSRALLMQKLDRSGTATGVANALVAPANNPAFPVPATSVLGLPPAANPLVQPPFPALTGFPAGLPSGAETIPPVDSIGIPSECLLLKNMFDPNVETEPDFDLDIKEDVQDECSKYGKVKHIFVGKNTAGFVYLRFDNATSASNAQRALHGRWFAGKMITATFMIPSDYEAKFPSSS